jgi:hypothetical protein
MEPGYQLCFWKISFRQRFTAATRKPVVVIAGVSVTVRRGGVVLGFELTQVVWHDIFEIF